MKTTELRIGNILELPNKHPVQISVDSLKEIESGIHPYQKIQLTEEWLLKFGFEKDSDGVLKIRNCMYWLDTGFLQLAMGYAPLINAPCKYVHQLQNLYFALTNTELIIK